MKRIILAIAVISSLSSCMMQKDIYSGESVNLKSPQILKVNHEGNNVVIHSEEIVSEPKILQNNTVNQSEYSNDNISEIDSKELNIEEENNTLTSIPESECDVIILQNGDEIEAKVLEIGTDEIKYKKCNNQEGPTITIKNSQVLLVKYPNGSKDIIKQNTNQSTNSTSNQNNSNSTTGKSQIVALILCFFLGVLGIHRFYLGYPGIGILMLLTGGLFGILLFIDFIRLITGGLKPKDGNYKDSF
jgi:TM2 domain-containing membrane protein YozV